MLVVEYFILNKRENQIFEILEFRDLGP